MEKRLSFQAGEHRPEVIYEPDGAPSVGVTLEIEGAGKGYFVRFAGAADGAGDTGEY